MTTVTTIRSQAAAIEEVANQYARQQIKELWIAINEMNLPEIHELEKYNNGTDYLDPLVTADLSALPRKLHIGRDRDRAVLVLPSGSAKVKNLVYFERYTPTPTQPFILIDQKKNMNTSNNPLVMLQDLLILLQNES